MIKLQEKDKRSFPQNTDLDQIKNRYTKTINRGVHQLSQTFESQTKSQLS